MNIKASVDIGSNSILLLIMDTVTKEILCEESRITSLGKDLDITQVFHDDSMASSFHALSEYKDFCQNYKINLSDVIVTATEASRVAKNSKEFFLKVKNDLGFIVTTITGEGEAYYTALGISLMSDLSGDFVVMDIGGASTELIHVTKDPFKIHNTVSLPLGSVRTTDWIKNGSDKEGFSSVLSGKDFSMYMDMNLVCVAGTMTSLATIFSGSQEYDAKKINNLSLSSDDLKNKIIDFLSLEDSYINNNFNFLESRKESIKGGARCASEILSVIKFNNVSFSTYGLRYGTILCGAIDECYSV